jgi:MFS transporter, putative metabolite:H+ symporter
LLAVIGIVLRVQLPESPRWLITRGRIEEAHQVVRTMEAIAEAHGPLKPIQRALPVSAPPAVLPYAAILRDPNYLRRTVLLTAMWFVSYVTVYAFAAGFTTLLAALKYPPPEALIAPLIPQLGVLTSMLISGSGRAHSTVRNLYAEPTARRGLPLSLQFIKRRRHLWGQRADVA